MATQLFLLSTPADTHLGTNNLDIKVSSGRGWDSRALSTARGSGVTSLSRSTTTGPTSGEEIESGTNTVEWISPPVAADVTIAGTITGNLWSSESNMSANVAINFAVDVIRANVLGTRDSNTLVQIAKSARVVEVAVTTRAANNFTVSPTSTVVNRGDRLRIRVFGDDVGAMAAAFTFDLGFNGSSAAADGDSYITLTENVTFEAPPQALIQPSQADGTRSFGGPTQQQTATAFLNGSLTQLSEVKGWIRKNGAPTDNCIVELQTDSGGFPSGTVLTTLATITGTSLTTSFAEFTWSTSVTLSAATTYHIVFRRSGATDASNFYFTPYGVSSGGVWLGINTYNGTSWSVFGTGSGATLALRFADQQNIYLTDTASAVSTASVDREAWTSRGAGVQTDVVNTAGFPVVPIQLTDTAGGTVVDWFTRPLTAFTLTGMAVANLRALESNPAANASLRCEIARVAGDGTSPTVWANWCIAPTGTDLGELTTSEVARTANVSGGDLAITDGQRLRIRVYIDDISTALMAASQTVTFYYAGTSGGASGDSYITFPQTLTEYSSGPFTYTKAGFGKESG